MQRVAGSTSTKTGLAPTASIASAVAAKVIATVITSSPGLMPSAIRARRSASVPEADRDCVPRAGEHCKFRLEGRDLRTEDESSALEHARDGTLDLLAAREEAPARIGLRNLRQFAVFHSAQKPYIPMRNADRLRPSCSAGRVVGTGSRKPKADARERK